MPTHALLKHSTFIYTTPDTNPQCLLLTLFTMGSINISKTVGVLALQGGFAEHVDLVRKAATQIHALDIQAIEVRTVEHLAQCDALIIPGGESTTMAFVAAQSGLLEPLRSFVK